MPTQNSGMFTELLQAEIWRKKLEAAGYRVVTEVWQPSRDERPSQGNGPTTLPGLGHSPA